MFQLHCQRVQLAIQCASGAQESSILFLAQVGFQQVMKLAGRLIQPLRFPRIESHEFAHRSPHLVVLRPQALHQGRLRLHPRERRVEDLLLETHMTVEFATELLSDLCSVSFVRAQAGEQTLHRSMLVLQKLQRQGQVRHAGYCLCPERESPAFG